MDEVRVGSEGREEDGEGVEVEVQNKESEWVEVIVIYLLGRGMIRRGNVKVKVIMG